MQGRAHGVRSIIRFFAFALLLGTAYSAQAGTFYCSSYGGVIDGFDPATFAYISTTNNTLGIDSNCTIKNWPQNNGIGGFPITNINFYFPGGAQYYIVFDNVYYPGNMSCNSPSNSNFWIYWAPGSFNKISSACQSFMVPVDAVKKLNPPAQTTATIGVPFSYTITTPYLGMLDSTGTFNYVANFDSQPISNVVITDDLTQNNTAALTYVNNSAVAYQVDSAGNRTLLGPVVTGASSTWLAAHPVSTTQPRLSDNTKHLVFSYENNPILAAGVPAGYHIEIDLQVVLDNNTTANTPGNTFTNTAGMWFDKDIVVNGTTTHVADLYGWPSTTLPLTVAGPNLVVNKTSTTSNLNVGATAPFKIDVQNTGGSTAWDATITDNIPAGMCANAPGAFAAQLVAADGTTVLSNLVQGTDYSYNWTGPSASSCQFTLSMLDTSPNQIGPNQHLIITYGAKLDAGTGPGLTFNNIAGATSWYGANSSYTGRHWYSNTLTNGTPGTLDFQDVYTVTSATQGYFFLKSVENLTTGDSPAVAAFPGDTLRYTLQIQNFQVPALNNITVSDILDALNSPAAFVPNSLTLVSSNLPAGTTLTVNPTGGPQGTGSVSISGLNLLGDTQYQIQFDVTVASTLANNAIVANQASLSGKDASNVTWSGVSDDPYTNGPAQLSASGDPTRVTIQTPGALSKVNPAPATTTIGQQFSYTITVPSVPTSVPLYDVRILDTLPSNVSFVSAQSVSGGTWSITNTGTATNLVLQDTTTGIDIPANSQAVIQVTVAVQNTAANHGGSTPTTFVNSASYTYNKLNGINSTQGSGAAGTTGNMTVLEPLLAASKAVANVTSGKAATDPAATGDTLQYTVTITNGGSSEAFDADVMDTLPVNVSLVPGSAKVTIDGTADASFVATPTTLSSGALVWGNQNGDDSLDIPVGGTLVLTYQVKVVTANGTPITNSVYAAWTSLNGANPGERTGDGCPSTTSPNIYCTGPATSTLNSLDPTTLTKTVVSDSWSTAPSTANDSTLRVGDTVIYSLTLNLREGVTQGVVVTDQLPTNLAFDSVISINGVTASPYTSVAPFTYNSFTGPTISGSTVTWNLGDITNAVDNNPANNTFVIQYRARVVNTLAQQASPTSLPNIATINYAISGASATKTSSASITVWQPVMSTPTKTATGFTSPASVNVTTDHIPFTLQSCNTGPAPAYSAKLTDVLASQMDEASINITSVTSGSLASPTTLSAGPTGYTYAYDAPSRTMTFVFNTPVNQNECVTVNYTIGFHTNVPPNSTWTNSVTLSDYWSLPTPTTTGKEYNTPITSLPFTMTNPVAVTPLTKVVSSPTNGVATIGQDIYYTITIPSANATLSNVVVSDTLDGVLQYVGATAKDDLNNTVALTDTSSGNNVSLTIAQIPAGRTVSISLHARVANNGTANDKAGYSFTNTASYIYTGMAAGSTSGTSGPLSIVEPSIGINKSVSPGTPPTAGEVLNYTVTLTAPTGTSYSTAYDLVLADTLSAGQSYIPSSTKINGSNVADPTISGQTLTWSTTVPNMAPGSTVTVTYQAKVQNTITAGQVLSNSATVLWTSLSGASLDERNGSGTPSYNNYLATSTATLPPVGSNYSFSKVLNTTTYPAAPLPQDARIGDFVEYKLTLGLQEGTTNGVVVTDLLPAGLAYDSLVSITPVSGSNFTYTLSSQPSSGSTGTLTWNFGTVLNSADGITTDDNLVIVYRARVLNNSVLSQLPVTQTLTNSASLNFTGISAPLTSNQQIYVQQPMLAVTKGLVNTTSGSSIINAGDVIVYSVDIKNNGAGPAYDPVLTDTLPVGLRLGGVTTTSITLNGSPVASPIQPTSYNSSTGVITWNFDTGVADAYTILPGQTLHVEYKVTADPNLGSGLTLTNSASISSYYSFDNNAVPASGLATYRQVYGPTAASTYTLTSSTPGALGKANPSQLSAAIGQQFTYTITVPAVAAKTAIYDAQIIDTLPAGVEFVSVSRLSGGTWTPAGAVSGSTLTITAPGGIDIPAGQQVQLAVTVVLKNDTTVNYSGRQFTNSATYSYNQVKGTGPLVTTPPVTTTPAMTVVGPDTLTLTKTGPATMRVGVPGTFALTVKNTGTSRAWDVSITDLLPNPTPGGMCSVAPKISSVVNSGQPAGTSYSAGTDYSVTFATGTPTCNFTFIGVSDKVAIDPGQTLTITYTVGLDNDNPPGITLTNIAGATQWFSQDTNGAGATGETHTYTQTITDGTPTLPDFQDAHTVTTESPVLAVQKTVQNLTSGQNPGISAKPGDHLRYTITINNASAVDVPSFSLTDDLGALNPTVVFVPGSLNIVSAPSGSGITNASSSSGGTNGEGLVSLSGLSLGAQGSASASMTLVFDVVLAPVIKSGTLVLNQGHLYAYGNLLANTDDPNINGADDPNVLGDENPTQTLIASAPLMQVQKISQDMTGNTNVLLAGDTLHYTITVKNIGTENATGVTLSDLIPNFTTYVGGTTRLNGVIVADPSTGVSALQGSLQIKPATGSTLGDMPADADPTHTGNVATITFDVKVNSNVLNGTIISNQGFVNGSGAGSGPFPASPSDDPATPASNDPTRNIVGSLPMLNATKVVSLLTDANGNGAVDPGDVLRYTISVNNRSTIPATGVTLTDAVPVNTSYVANTVTLNGIPVGQPDGGVSPLITGASLNSPSSAAGTIAAGSTAVVTFDVTVNAGVTGGTVISNQGNVSSTELPSLLTDADGDPSNGYQPTNLVVGSAQQLTISKEVLVVGGGAATAGSQLEYVVTVTNKGAAAATNVVLTDDLTPLSGLASYVAGSATLNGAPTGVTYAASVVTADYSTTYGTLAPGATVTLRFKVQTVSSLPDGTTLNNTAQVAWNSPALTASASAAVAINGIPGYAKLNGHAWLDPNFNKVADSGEMNLSGWTVELWRNGVRLGSTTTDANGLYSFSGLAPTVTTADQYELHFIAPGAGFSTAKLGLADSVFTNGLQLIRNIAASSGSNIQNLNLPIDPNGVVYDSLRRTPITGATLTMTRAGSTVSLPVSCFDDAAQQNQVTLSSGFYKFDLNFSDPACPRNVDYVIRVTPPASGYVPGVSLMIPPVTSDTTATALDVPNCPGSIDDAVATPPGYCEAQASASAPSAPARTTGTNYYLRLTLSDTSIPGSSQIFNNHIPLDPTLQSALTITKTAALVNVSRGQLVPYTITVSNSLGVNLTGMGIVDTFPPDFKYVAGSSRVNGLPVEPARTNRQLTWSNLQFTNGTPLTIKLLFIVGAGVSDGEYVNHAQAYNQLTGAAASGDATATVRVVPDPTFDCTDIIGKVFDDANRNGYQDKGEKGLPGVRLATARGLLVTTDAYGRYHITCAATPDEDRGSNFIIKVDERTLPTGYRITTENPLVLRATRGKMMKFNFGAAIHKVVRLDMSDGVFEPGTSELRIQWKSRLDLLMSELRKGPSILRVAYMAEVEDEALVDARLKAVKKEIAHRWSQEQDGYELEIETEVFWRTGAPPDRSSLK